MLSDLRLYAEQVISSGHLYHGQVGVVYGLPVDVCCLHPGEGVDAHAGGGDQNQPAHTKDH